MAPAPTMTVDEYFRTPETVLPQELAYGVWRLADAPTPRHQSIVFALAIAMEDLARREALGRVYLAPVDVVLDRERHLVVQPDLVFIAHERLGMVTDRIWGAPDLAIEVLSPRPRVGDIDERLTWFARYGVRECWLVRQQDRVVEVVQFADRAVVGRQTYMPAAPIRSGVLPAWHLSLDAVLDHTPGVGSGAPGT